jgi:hypothetical protein
LTQVQLAMTFWRDFFKDFNDNVDDIVYFADKSSLKSLGIGRNGSHEANDCRIPWEKIKDRHN